MTPYKIFLKCTAAIIFAALPFHAFADEDVSLNNYSIGVEGFHEIYREPGADVTFTTNYGSITGKWVHQWEGNNLFTALDGRYSSGSDSYKSGSGTYDGGREEETDDRIRLGINWGAWSPYIGAGVRYFVDNGKGHVTDLGSSAYDRRITQFYAPIGFSYNYVTSDGLNITPNFEFDPLVYGNVNTRLGTIPGFFNINNSQHSGFGLRGEIMAGWQMHKMELQAGPFVRYWKINDSDVTFDPVGRGWIEPHNTRIQYGLAVKLLW